MNRIAFIDLEVDSKNKRILDIGAVTEGGNIFHTNGIDDFVSFLDNVTFIGGHNIINHDLKYLEQFLPSGSLARFKVVDTLYFSPLLFPAKPYHALLKDDKLQTDELTTRLFINESTQFFLRQT